MYWLADGFLRTKPDEITNEIKALVAGSLYLETAAGAIKGHDNKLKRGQPSIFVRGVSTASRSSSSCSGMAPCLDVTMRD